MALFAVNFSTALATSCQVYPSEYAYKDDSVTRIESASANCRSYTEDYVEGGEHRENYIYCDGTQLKLADLSSISPLTIMCGVVGVVNNYCTHSP